MQGAAILAALTALVAVGGAGLFHREAGDGHDAWQYITCLVEFETAWSEQTLPPDWAPDLGHGHGHPLFLFLPPLPYLVAMVFRAAGAPVGVSLNLTFLLALWLGALGMFLWCRERLHDDLSALVGAGAFVLAPYVAVNLYLRAAWGEHAGLCAIPWVLWGAQGREARHAWAMGLGVAALLLSHNPMALMGALMVLAFRPSWRAVQAGLAGALLSAWFWVPALLLRKSVHTDRLLEGYNHYRWHFVGVDQLLHMPWEAGILEPGGTDHLPQYVGVPLLMAWWLLPAWWWWPGSSKAAPRGFMAGLWGAATVGLWLTTRYSAPVWDLVTPIQYFQFPMRWLAGVTVLLAALLGCLVRQAGQRRAWLAAGILMGMVVAAWPRAQFKGRTTNAWVTPELVATRGMRGVSKDEFQPRSAVLAPQETSPVVQGSVRVVRAGRTPLESHAGLQAEKPALVQLDRLDFAGWQVKVDGVPTAHQAHPVSGRIQVEVPAGNHELSARWTGHPWRAPLLWAAPLGLLVLLWTARARRGDVRQAAAS